MTTPGTPSAITDAATDADTDFAAGLEVAAVVERDQLRVEALEQLMRLSADETHIYGLLDSVDTDTAATLVGRVLACLDLTLVPGCPLLAYGAGKPLDHAWRRNYPPAERSLYAELLFCRQLAGIAPGEEGEWEDAFAELEHLREVIGVTDMT